MTYATQKLQIKFVRWLLPDSLRYRTKCQKSSAVIKQFDDYPNSAFTKGVKEDCK